MLNNSRVIPARLRGVNALTGGAVRALLLEENAVNDWWAMLRPARRARTGARIQIQDARARPSGVQAVVIEANAEGHRRLRFAGTPNVLERLNTLGEVPLPPYIARPNGSRLGIGSGALPNGLCAARRIGGGSHGGVAFHRGAAGANRRARHLGLFSHAACGPGHLCAREGGNASRAPDARGTLRTQRGDCPRHQCRPVGRAAM